MDNVKQILSGQEKRIMDLRLPITQLPQRPSFRWGTTYIICTPLPLPRYDKNSRYHVTSPIDILVSLKDKDFLRKLNHSVIITISNVSNITTVFIRV